MSIKKVMGSLSLGLAIVLGISGCTITRSKFPISIKGNEYSIDDAKKSDIKGIEDILIENTSGNINIIPQERKNIEAHLHGKPELNLSISNGKLTLSSKSKSNIAIGFHSSSIKLDIYS